MQIKNRCRFGISILLVGLFHFGYSVAEETKCVKDFCPSSHLVEIKKQKLKEIYYNCAKEIESIGFQAYCGSKSVCYEKEHAMENEIKKGPLSSGTVHGYLNPFKWTRNIPHIKIDEYTNIEDLKKTCLEYLGKSELISLEEELIAKEQNELDSNRLKIINIHEEAFFIEATYNDRIHLIPRPLNFILKHAKTSGFADFFEQERKNIQNEEGGDELRKKFYGSINAYYDDLFVFVYQELQKYRDNEIILQESFNKY